jgi:hypothetical protein
VSAGILPQRAATVVDASRRAGLKWLVSPWFDLLFIANVAWPLALFLPVSDEFSGHAGLQFWQLYYITTPHRWITLALVFLDRERFQQRRGTFLIVAAAAVAVCAGVRLTTGALTCLLAVDYVWNAWHFASQHHGIYRIYARLGESAPPAHLVLEKWLMRGFLLYVILRVASATWSNRAWDSFLGWFDFLAAAVALGLVARCLSRPGESALGRNSYLVSMSFLYLALLWAVHTHRPGLVLALATASALFHAIEYLSLVSWSVQTRHQRLGDRMGLLGHFVPRWGLVLGMFMLVLGAGGWFIDTQYVDEWLLVNVIVAFLHYAYDGLIWRRSGTAG